MTGEVDPESARGRRPGCRPAEASGSTGSSVTIEPLAGPTLEASTPPLAQTKPWARLGDDHAVGPSGRPAAPRAGRPRPGAGRGPSARRTRPPPAAARSSVRSTIAPSAFDTTFWVTTRTSSARERREPGASGSVARRVGEDRRRGRRRAGSPGSRRARRPRAGRRSVSRHGPGRAGRSVLGQEQVVGRVEVEGQRSVELERSRAPAAAAAARWAARLSAPNANGIASGGLTQQRVRAAAVAVGDERDERPFGSAPSPAARPRPRPPIVVGEIAGRSAGRTSSARGAVGRAPSGPSLERPRSGRRRRCRIGVGPGGAGDRAQDGRVRADHDDRSERVDRLGARRTVRSSRSRTSAWRSSASSVVAEPRLRPLERADRARSATSRDRSACGTQLGHGRHPSRCGVDDPSDQASDPVRAAKSSISRGQPGPGRVVGHDRVGDERPQPERLDRRREVRVDRVERRSRRRARRSSPGDAERARLVAERDEHPVGRSLERPAADDPGDRDDRDAPARARRRWPRACPGTARIGPIETIGFDGAITIDARPSPSAAATSASAVRRLDPVEADLVDRRAPGGDGRSTPGTRASRRRSGPRSGPGRRSSAGSWRRPRATAGGPRRPRSAGRRARSRAVRTMCVARSRSPSRNQVSSP